MRLHALALLLLLSLSSCAVRGANAFDPPIASAPALGDRFPANVVRFPDGIVARGDLVYDVVPGFRPLTLDLYKSSRNRGRAAPLVVYVHGGAWMGGHGRQAGALADFPAFLAALSAHGYVVASVNYRLSGEARFPAALRDVITAIGWLRANAGQFGIDPGRVVIWGSSAGGQLAGLAALSCGAQELQGASFASRSDCVQGAVLWYPATDFGTVADQAGPERATRHAGAGAPPAAYLGCALPSCESGLIRRASVTSFVDAADPPILLIHGQNDQTVPWRQSAQLADLLLAASVDTQFVLIPEVGHSFIGADPAATRAATLQALTATIAFIDRAAGIPPRVSSARDGS